MSSTKRNKKVKFVNELGNDIRLKIERSKDQGRNKKTGKKYRFDSVTITMTGPTSISENTITYKEARVMRKYLDKFLKENKMKSFKKIN